MGLSDMIGQLRPHRKVRLGTRCNYQLTALGKTKAEKFGVEGPSWDVLAYLDENGQSTLRDISEGAHLSEEKSRNILKRLISSGYVTSVSTEG